MASTKESPISQTHHQDPVSHSNGFDSNLTSHQNKAMDKSPNLELSFNGEPRTYGHGPGSTDNKENEI
jgi:hypothetical protein